MKGQALLAAPAFLTKVVAHDGRVQRLTGGDGSPQLEMASPTRAVYTGSLHQGQVKMDIRNETEYNGCSKVTLQISPGTPPEEIRRLTLVLPLSAEYARYNQRQGFCILQQLLDRRSARGRKDASSVHI